MIIQLNAASGVPLYLQIVEQVKHAIETGAIRAGEQLPSVRQVAEELTVNPNTVAHAYKELEHENVIEIRHGSGAFISDSVLPRASLMQKAQSLARAAVKKLSSLGLTEDEIRRLIQNELASLASSFRGKKKRVS
jgi:GntR family transcriptional regulator